MRPSSPAKRSSSSPKEIVRALANAAAAPRTASAPPATPSLVALLAPAVASALKVSALSASPRPVTLTFTAVPLSRSSMVPDAMTLPRSTTATRSHTCSTSLKRCELRNTAVPREARPRCERCA